MHDLIACPDCKRRLQLPTDSPIDVVRCPSCGSQFPADSVPRLIGRSDVASSVNPQGPPLPAGRGSEPQRNEPQRKARSQTPKRPARSPWVIVLAALACVLVVTAAGGFGIALIIKKVNPSSPRSYPTSSAMVYDDEPVVVANQPPLNEEDIGPEVKPLFDDLGGAFRAGNRARMMARFDAPRMTDEVLSLAALTLSNPKQKRDFGRQMAQGLEAHLVANVAGLKWTAVEIRKVKKLNDTEALVILRHDLPDGSTTAIRWWLTRRSGSWKIYDLEEIEVGVRTSLWIASYNSAGIDGLAETNRALIALRDAHNAVTVRQEVKAADEKLQPIAKMALSRPLEAFRFRVQGLIYEQRQDYEKALAALDKAQDLQPDVPLHDFLKGRYLDRMNQFEEALTHLDKYWQLVGDDPDICAERGIALRNLNRYAEAARSYRKALDLNPKHVGAFLGLLRTPATNDAPNDLGVRFAQLGDARTNFDLLAHYCEMLESPELLEPLLPIMRASNPNHAPLLYFTAVIRAREGKATQAVPLFKSALDWQVDPEKRKEYKDGFLKAMMRGGKFADAYAALPSAETFRTLAVEAMNYYQQDELRRLVALHRQANAKDPLLPWYQAEVHVRDGRYALAEKSFTEALAGPADEETRTRFRSSRVLAQYHTGKALAAYRDIGPKDETFRQLAELAFQDRHDEQLQALLDAHAKSQPDNFDLLSYRCRLQIRQGKTEEAIASFKAALTKQPSNEQRQELLYSFLTDMVTAGKLLESYRAAPDALEAFKTLADSFLEEGQYDDLRRLVEAHRKGHADDLWLSYYEGQVQLNDKAWDKAAQVLNEAWKKAPKEFRERIRWSLVYAQYKAGRGMQAYEEIEPRTTTFNYLTGYLVGDKKGAELEALIAAHRPHAANDGELEYNEARAKVLAKQPGEAAALLEKACRKQTVENRRKWYVTSIMQDLESAGLGMEGYRIVADKPAAFEVLAARWTSQKKDKELAALLDEHGKSHAADLNYLCYRGELYLLRGEAKQAAALFAECLAKATPQNTWRYRNSLFRTRIKAGEVVATYREFDASSTTFETLAGLCVQEKNAGQLQALLDAYRGANADDPGLISWEAQIKWLNGAYEEVLALLTAHREDVFELPRYRWQADNHRVRCLVKLKRAEEAVRAAEASVTQRYGSRTLLVLAHAATGNVEKTIAVAEKPRLQSYMLQSCYTDPDLGPILNSDAFKAFREKFPEPKDDPGRIYLDDDEP